MAIRHVPYSGYSAVENFSPLLDNPLYDALSPSEVAGLDNTKVSSVYGTPKKKKKAKQANPVSKEKLSTSRIRVQLSRPLTWAEKEHLETNHDDPDLRRINDTTKPLGLSLRVADNKEHVWVEAPFGSRITFELLAAALEQNFVNVFPKAVRTFREYNGN